MRRFKFIGTEKEAEDYQENIPKLGRIYDEDDIIGNLNLCAVLFWNETYPNEWQEIIVSDSEVKWTPINDGWVSINDRMPENQQECILFNGEVLSGYIYSEQRKSWFDNGEGFYYVTDATHWMPLPKPPIK